MPRLEKYIEREAKRRVDKAGGLLIKLTGYKGIPDRMALLPGGQVRFMEFKSDSGEVEEAQEVYHEKLRSLGFSVAVIANYETLDLFLPR